jgi:hypothetical protein
MVRRWRVGYPSSVGLIILGLGASSCGAILGVDKDYHGVGGGGDGGSADMSSQTASGTGSTGSTSSSSGGGGGSCTSPTPGGGACDYHPGNECGCSSAQKCSVTNEATGAASCIPAGGLGLHEKCTADADCAKGSWCDHFTGTCEEICLSSADCDGGTCVNAPQVNPASTIPGLQVCTANCEPVTTAPCGSGVTCAFDASSTVQGFDCFVSGLNPEGAMCNLSRDCDKGLVCIVVGSKKSCERWCTPVGTTFPGTANHCASAKPKCVAFSTPFTRNGVEYGTCEP